MRGQKIGRLYVVCESVIKRDRRTCWVCLCDCGRVKTISGKLLRNGHARSCGCRERMKHGKYKSRIYNCWRDMKDRCYNEHNPRYKDYGGRGIKVCDRWLDFNNFYADMGDKPKGKSIDRIDNDGDYCPENCKWSTRSEQQWNTRAKGYSYCKIKGKYAARANRNKKYYNLGYYDTPEEARQAYLKFKKEFAEGKYDSAFS